MSSTFKYIIRSLSLLIVLIGGYNIAFSQQPLLLDENINSEALIKNVFTSNLCQSKNYGNFVRNIAFPYYNQFISNKKDLVEKQYIITGEENIEFCKCFYNADETLSEINIYMLQVKNNTIVDTYYQVNQKYSYNNNNQSIRVVTNQVYKSHKLQFSEIIDTSIYYYSNKFRLDSAIIELDHKKNEKLYYSYNDYGDLIEIYRKTISGNNVIVSQFAYNDVPFKDMEIFDFDKNEEINFYQKPTQNSTLAKKITVTHCKKQWQNIVYKYNTLQSNTIDLLYFNQLDSSYSKAGTAISAKWKEQKLEQFRIKNWNNNSIPSQYYNDSNTNNSCTFGFNKNALSILYFNFEKRIGKGYRNLGINPFVEGIALLPKSIKINYIFANRTETNTIIY